MRFGISLLVPRAAAGQNVPYAELYRCAPSPKYYDVKN